MNLNSIKFCSGTKWTGNCFILQVLNILLKQKSCYDVLFFMGYGYIHIYLPNPSISKGCPRGVMVKAMNCGIVVREFVLQSRYYVHFRANTLGKGMNPLILPPAMGK